MRLESTHVSARLQGRVSMRKDRKRRNPSPQLATTNQGAESLQSWVWGKQRGGRVVMELVGEATAILSWGDTAMN